MEAERTRIACACCQLQQDERYVMDEEQEPTPEEIARQYAQEHGRVEDEEE